MGNIVMGLDKNFFERKPGIVARTLLGKLLVRKIGSTYRLGMIVETEAYLGEDDKASHSHRGQTKRNAPMFGPAGFSYVYFTYGMHWLLNIVTEKEGKASAVLIRAVEPLNVLGGPADLKKMGSGPARLTKWLRANGEQSNMDLTKSSDLFITDEIEIEGRKYKAVQVAPGMIVATTRIGVDYAEEHKDLPLRFYIKGNKYISKV